MRRLFAGEMQEQRLQIEERLHAPTEPSPESGLTLVAPLLGSAPGSWSGLRSATQVSSVTDLMEELTRQRRTTTRLLGSLLGIFAAAALVGLYLLVVGTRSAPNAAAAALPAAIIPPAAVPAPAPASASPSAVSPPPAESAARVIPVRARQAAAPPMAAVSWPRSAKSGPRAETTERSSAAPAPEPAPTLEHGFLNLDTTPWSVVSIGGRALGQTPIVGASLPAGTHTLVLSNPELGVKTTYQVTISAGRTTARRVGLD